MKIEWDALNYLASKNKKQGREIIDSTLVLLKRTELPDIGDPARVTGRMMVSGAIVYDCLIPGKEDLIITPVGGPGKEFWVFGTNHENEIRSSGENTYERAAWRIEISSKKPSPENCFLNIMQVMENGIEEIEAKQIEDDKVLI